MARIVVTKAGKELFRHEIRKKLVSIGRSPQCDIVLAEADVSSLHANVLGLRDGYQLVDLDSTNGTQVNGAPVTEQTLRHAMVFSIGQFALRFEEAPAAAEGVTALFPGADSLRESSDLLKTIRYSHLSHIAQANKGAGIALERSLTDLEAAIASAERSNAQLAILFELAEAINSAKGYTVILEIILEKALLATGMERGAVVLYTAEAALEPVASVGMEQDVADKNAFVMSHSIINKAIEADQPLVVADTHATSEFNAASSIVTQGIKSSICLPLKSRSRKMLGGLYLDSRFASMHPDNTRPELLRIFSIFTGTAIETRQAAQREKEMAEELAAAREREKYNRRLQELEQENKRLVKKAGANRRHDVLGESPAIRNLFDMVEKVAPTDVPLLLTGETGTGKSLLAKFIHDFSERRQAECVIIDCASIPSELLESELFGYEKGAFTGAAAQKKGKIETADNGTLFLDEIGDMPLALQAKMLRFLQDRQFERVGGTKTISINVRIIAASNKDLKNAVSLKLFREDLFYRLCGVTLDMPPLRERGEDILIMASSFLNEVATRNSLTIKGFTPEARNLVLAYAWPGNVRELRNVVQRAAILCKGEFIEPDDLGLDSAGIDRKKEQTLKEARDEVDKKVVQQQLIEQKGNLSKVARILDLDRGTLRELIKKHNLSLQEEP